MHEKRGLNRIVTSNVLARIRKDSTGRFFGVWQAFSFVTQADDERLSLKLGGFGQSSLSGHVRISHVRLWKETKGKAEGK